VEEQEPQLTAVLQGYWKTVVRRRHWIVGAMVIGWAVALGGSLHLGDRYRSETLILVEQQRVPQHYVVSNIAVDLQERLQSMTQQILSRTRLQKIIEDMNLYGKASRSDLDALIARMRRDIQIDLVRAEGRGDLTAFKISYSASTPNLAQEVASRLTSLFIEENLRNRKEQSEETTAFLETQQEVARQSLAEQEQKLREFKTRFLGELPEQLQGNLSILSGLQDRLNAATSTLNQAQQQRLYLQSVEAQYRGTAGGNNGLTSDPDVARLRAALAEMQAHYTERHPDVVRLKGQLAEAERAEQRSLQTLDDASSSTLPSATTPLSQVQSQLKVNELEISSRQKEIEALQRQIDHYQRRLNLTPVREQQLAALTRDYEQSRNNYESLLAKRQQSELATNLEKQQQGEQFRVLDPPNLPQTPYFPNRLMIGLAGLAGGFAFGVVGSVVVEFLDPRIYGEEELLKLAPAPILVAVPPVPTEKESSREVRRGRMEIAVAGMLVLIVPAMTLLVHYKG
jgi:succinoglycan biosynthesis transport protein ExoP